MVSKTRKIIHKKKRNTRVKRQSHIGGKAQWNNFQNVGKSLDDFFTLFNIDELSKKNARDYLGYKTYNRNNLFNFTLLPSTIRDNQYSGVKITRNVKNDIGLNLMDTIAYDINNVDHHLGELILGTYNITNKNNRKGTFTKEINIKEPLRDNLEAVNEPNIATFVDNRFRPIKP